MDISPTTQFLVNALQRGKANAIRRDILSGMMGLGDRQTRMAVSLARLEGICICNDQDGSGYYLPAEEDECRRQYRQTASRGKKILAQLKGLRDLIEKFADEEQLSLFDTAENSLETALTALGKAVGDE